MIRQFPAGIPNGSIATHMISVCKARALWKLISLEHTGCWVTRLAFTGGAVRYARVFVWRATVVVTTNKVIHAGLQFIVFHSTMWRNIHQCVRQKLLENRWVNCEWSSPVPRRPLSESSTLTFWQIHFDEVKQQCQCGLARRYFRQPFLAANCNSIIIVFVILIKRCCGWWCEALSTLLVSTNSVAQWANENRSDRHFWH